MSSSRALLPDPDKPSAGKTGPSNDYGRWGSCEFGSITCGPGSYYFKDPTITERKLNIKDLVAARKFVHEENLRNPSNPIVIWQVNHTGSWDEVKTEHFLIFHRKKFLKQNLDSHTHTASGFCTEIAVAQKGKRWRSDMFYDIYDGDYSATSAATKRMSTQKYGKTTQYIGETQNDERHGHGYCVFEDGGFYEGQWRNGKQNGRGTFYLADGGSYNGDWRNDAFEGEGTYLYGTGERYEGSFLKGKQHGHGRMSYTDESGDPAWIEGKFANDEFAGEDARWDEGDEEEDDEASPAVGGTNWTEFDQDDIDGLDEVPPSALHKIAAVEEFENLVALTACNMGKPTADCSPKLLPNFRMTQHDGKNGYAVYEMHVPKTGKYYLATFYTSADPRPLKITIDDDNESRICGNTVGNFRSDSMEWFREGDTFRLQKGTVRIRLETTGYWPHVGCLLFRRKRPFSKNMKSNAPWRTNGEDALQHQGGGDNNTEDERPDASNTAWLKAPAWPEGPRNETAYKLFCDFDDDESGYLSKSEFSALFLSYYPEVSACDILKEMKEADENGDGRLSYGEFITVAEKLFHIPEVDDEEEEEEEPKPSAAAVDLDEEEEGYITQPAAAAAAAAAAVNLDDEEEGYLPQPGVLPAAIAENIPPPRIRPQKGRGHCKSLWIGINYPRSQAPLSGCWNDVITMQKVAAALGFDLGDKRVLVDKKKFPDRYGGATRKEIEDGFKWLVKGAKSGDQLFVHYSGHGTSVKEEVKGEEENGMDEALVPEDYKTAGLIRDNFINEQLAKLPEGVRVTVVVDACHSGSMCDLAHEWRWRGEEKKFKASSSTGSAARDFRVSSKKYCAADIISFSGCKDSQTSADVSDVASFDHLMADGPGKAGGACTNALAEALCAAMDDEQKPKITYLELLYRLQEILARRKFTQVPQLSSSRRIDMDEEFNLFDLLELAM